MDEQTRRKIYQTTSLVAGLVAVGAMALLLIGGLSLLPLKYEEIVWSVCCYTILLGSVTSIVSAILGKNTTPLQGVTVALAVLILPLVLIMDPLRRESGEHFSRSDCRKDQRNAFYRQITETSSSFPTSVADCHLPECKIYRQFPPWFPAVPGRVGMNTYLLGKAYDSIPHPERTVCFADCLPADGRIRGPQDIDWTRHYSSCNILLCNGDYWNQNLVKREELIFNPWPSNAPRPPSPPARSRPAPPASRQP